jgi:predicted transcriptional regulator
MTNLSKRAIMIRKMRDKGLTYESIGEILGISRQAVHQAANAGNGFRISTVDKVKYIGLRKWMTDNGVSVAELERRCGTSRLHHSLIRDVEPRKKTIDAILRVTGLTYEECFKEAS